MVRPTCRTLNDEEPLFNRSSPDFAHPETFKSLETSHEGVSEGNKQGAYFFLFPRVRVLRLNCPCQSLRFVRVWTFHGFPHSVLLFLQEVE